MEIITQKPQEKRENLSPTYSPNSTSSSSCINGSSSVQVPTPPLTPKPVSRSDVNPYPTTFVQADTSTFKQVVQMLTGSSETAKIAADPPYPAHPHPNTNKLSSSSSSSSIPPIKSTGQKKQGFKLYERRNSLKNGFIISPLIPASPAAAASATVGFSPRNRQAEILSPSILDFPSLVLSPVTPLNEDPFYNNNNYNSSSSSPSMAGANSSEEEEKAIAEKKFYLLPSPRTATPRNSEPPQLLPLFPVTSPRVSGTTTTTTSSS